MSDRTYGATRNCKGCKFWSEMIAQAMGGGPVTAMCLVQGGKYSSQYTPGHATCSAYEPGYDGAIDQPGGYDDDVDEDDLFVAIPIDEDAGADVCEHGVALDQDCVQCDESLIDTDDDIEPKSVSVTICEHGKPLAEQCDGCDQYARDCDSAFPP